MIAPVADTESPCIDVEERELCDWAYSSGEDDVGQADAWVCKTCGCVDINRDPPSEE